MHQSRNRLQGRSFNTCASNRRDSTETAYGNNAGAVQTGLSSAKTEFPTSKKKATTRGPPPHSLEFYVWSDEGINLFVDLNSSPADWTNRFRNEICTSENVYRKGSGSLWQDLSCLNEHSTQGKISSLLNTNSSQIDYHNGQVESSLGLKYAKDDDVTGLDQQIKDGCPLIYDPSAPSSMTTNVADYLKEYESTVSAEISYSVPNNYISGAESCDKDSSKNIIDSDAADTLLIKSLCCSVGNSPSYPDMSERQNSKPHNEISEDCDMLSGSMELQISEAASCHKYASHSLSENDGFRDLSDPKSTLDVEEGRLVNLSEINLDTEGNNLPSLTKEWV